MNWVAWLAIAGGVVAFLLGMWKLFLDRVDAMHAATAPAKKYAKPEPGSDLEFDAVKFIDATWRCPFCHSVLEPAIEGHHNMARNFYCTNAACNSHFLIIPMPPAGQMEVQYLGPLPDDVLIRYHMLGESRRH